MLVDQNNVTDEQLTRAVLRLNGQIMGLAFGVLVGLTLWIATLWLVIKGGPHVGQHLVLLSQFFIGYRVTVTGSFVGLVWGFVTGFVAGWLVAWIYNGIVAWRNRSVPR